MKTRRGDGALLRMLEGLALRDQQVVHVETLPEREAAHRDPAEPLPDEIAGRLAEQGITRLYTHQAEAVDRIRARENVVVVTGTASGKTLCYNLPVLSTLCHDPTARALYLFPTKALAQDQLKTLKQFMAEGDAGGSGRRRARVGRRKGDERDGVAGTGAAGGGGGLSFRAGTYDGDTPTTLRSRLRDEANILLTNPDMLHSGILPHHARWAEFFHKLQYVVVDEIHVYRGIFGSHVANVLRRLRRVCRHHGSDPIFICASATIANPQGLAERLTGLSFSLIDSDGSPRGRKHFIFWNPPRVGAAGMERRSTGHEAKEILVRLLREGYQAITFVRTRTLTEVLLRLCQEDLRRDGGGLSKRVRAYRAGYLPEERRRIEAALFEGELLGVISTNALELGIDVGSLDAALLVGYPGTIASTWQQAGRAGRREEESAAVLLAHNAPIDQYLMAHPEYFLGRSPEQAILDPSNPHILLNHLRCAAFEIPISRSEEEGFGDYAPAILDLLREREHLNEVKGRWFYTRGDYPSASFSLRNAGENVYTIVETPGSESEVRSAAPLSAPEGRENRVIGTIDELSAFSQVHPQAIYLQDGETYFVDRLDLSERAAYVHRVEQDYYTQAVSDNYIDAREADLSRVWNNAELNFGECLVHDKVTMFKKIKFASRDSLGWGTIELPHTTLHTVAFWLTPPAESLAKVASWGRVPADGLQGIANVLGSVISLYAMCDPNDLGTLVEMRNPSGATLFAYDKYPGGLGYAQRAYHQCEEILRASLEMIQRCPCRDGCPSCVGSPILPQVSQDPDLIMKGRIPDKEAALILLHALLGLPDYEPKEPLGAERAARARALLQGRVTGPAPSLEIDAGGEGDGDSPGASPADKRSRGRSPARSKPRAPRDVRPLPPDLRRKLEGQIERLSESPRGLRRGPSHA